MSNPLFFIHIPKTAGTSMRVALENHLLTKRSPSETILCDYGKDNLATSQSVRNHVYDQQDFYQLVSQNSHCRLLTGHVTYAKYAALFPVTDIFTVVRDPIERLISEYRHFQRHFDYSDSFQAFTSMRGKQNTLTRYLQGTPWQSLGYIALSDRFADGIDDINQIFALNLTSVRVNEAPAEQIADISESDMRHAQKLNAIDIRLYKMILKQHQQRDFCRQHKVPFVHSKFQLDFASGELSGFAFWHPYSQRDDAVAIELELRDKHGTTSTLLSFDARDYHQGLAVKGAPRRGHVGFTAAVAAERLPASISALRESGATLLMREPETQQILFQW